MRKIDYGTKFKIEWAEGKTDVTDKYTGKELSLVEFIYIITKRHHEIALDGVENGFYGSYDKHKVWIKYDEDSEWEPIMRFDLGNDDDWDEIRKCIKENLADYIDSYWGNFVERGLQVWKNQEKSA